MRSNTSKMSTSRKKVSPIYNIRRNTPRPKVNFDGTVLHGTELSLTLVTVANSAANNFFIDCSTLGTSVGTNFTQSVSADLNQISARYAEYRFLNVKVKWIPHVAPGVLDAGSPMYVAYTDNPEIISNIAGFSMGTLLAAAKGFRNLKTFNAWQGWQYNVPLTRRLPWFNVNSSTSPLTADVLARCVQGCVIVAAESLSPAIDLGQLHVTYDVELRNLNTSTGT